MINAKTARTLTDVAAVEAEAKKRAIFEEKAKAISVNITKAANRGADETIYWLSKEEQKMDGLVDYLVTELRDAGYTIDTTDHSIIFIHW